MTNRRESNGAPLAEHADGGAARRFWLDLLRRTVAPVLDAGGERRLHRSMPQHRPLTEEQRRFEPLVSVARAALGLAGWLSGEPSEPEERAAWTHDAARCRAAIAAVVDPDSPDAGDFATSDLSICYGAQLSQALLLAKGSLFDPLDEAAKGHIREAFRLQRSRAAPQNNWLLFAAVNEAMLDACFGEHEPRTVDHALQMHRRWYVGQGVFSDGDHFAVNYYSSLVMHPVTLTILEHLGGRRKPWAAMRDEALSRAQSGAVLLERLIAPDGTFPPLGRSLCYRFGVLRLLGELGRRQRLPEALPPGGVRAAMTRVMERCVGGAGMFDHAGWLTPGLRGRQAAFAEKYMTTGSLYFCLTALGPLALSPSDAFWSDPPRPWTAHRAWEGEDFPLPRLG